MRSVLICLLALVVIVLAKRTNFQNVEGYTFEEYVRDFGKHYASPQEYKLHKQVFNNNLRKVITHNRDTSAKWRAAVNKFTDMTAAEQKRFRGLNEDLSRKLHAAAPTVAMAQLPNIALEDLPASVDWRTANPPVVSDVKDQGGCGSCWAHATVEEVESNVAQQTGTLLKLSPQNVVDCTPNPHQCGGSGGCNGATAELGIGYIADKGVASEADYPYHAVTQPCDETIGKTAKVTGFVKLPENNYTALVTAVATIGPIAISVAAGAWSSYGGGVFTGCDFSSIDIDHAVQLVGYGTDSGTDYWIVRNSWGPGWGEEGYIRMEKHSDGDMTKWCGTDPSPGDGSGCQGGPPTITVCGSCGIWYDNCYAVGGSIVHSDDA